MKKLLLILLLCYVSTGSAQDSMYARQVLDTLTSPSFWGRGYTKNGMARAADYIGTQMQSFGLKPLFEDSFYQHFSYSVNTFPSKMNVAINGCQLKPGEDYIVSPNSKTIKANARLERQDSFYYLNTSQHLSVTLQNKLTWSVAAKPSDHTNIIIVKSALKQPPQHIEVDIESLWIENFEAANIGAVVRGTQHPDSFLVLSAHYDHLGGMGANTYFPGANDNASGIALLLSLAKYYAAHPQPYSIVFLCFAGEEAGLIGSKYFTDHPPISLSQIRFLTNMDLVGTGIDGITVVNATEFAKDFAKLKTINEQKQFLPKINMRGKAANSDHYWFTELGIPSFFIYTLGGIAAYHDVHDIAATLPFTMYNKLFCLILEFNRELMR